MSTRRLIVLGSMSFAAVGIAVVLPGLFLPLLIDRLDLRFSGAGSLLAAQPLGHLSVVLVLPRVARNLDGRWSSAAGALVLGVGLVALGWVRTWPAALAAMAVTGFGIGAVEIGTNTVLLLNGAQPNRVLNFTHLFFGVASVLTPFLAASALAFGIPWFGIWASGAALVWLAAVAWVFCVAAPGFHGSDVPRPVVRRNARGHAAKIALAVAMGTYVGAEIGFGSWYTKYATSVHRLSLPAAGQGLAAYWAGLTLGRLLLALWAPGRSSVRFLATLALSATAAAASSLIAPGAAAFTALGALLGLSLAGIFPGILALAAQWYPGDVARVTGALLAGAGMGQMLFPWLMAVLADYTGIAAAMWMYPVLCLLVAASVVAGGAMERSRFVGRERRAGQG
ncbi:MAG: hypothetical protein KatS3mg077_3319 [Candidatus Binatia bacterium]|nr:MAG: hypothetical protein KatS3mg077_3319 [Candidatus Binatia bacterium]